MGWDNTWESVMGGSEPSWWNRNHRRNRTSQQLCWILHCTPTSFQQKPCNSCSDSTTICFTSLPSPIPKPPSELFGWRRCRYVCMYPYVQPSNICCLPAMVLKWLQLASRSDFPHQSASSEHYIEWNESSSPTLPIVIDIHSKIKKTSDYCSCPVYSLQCQTCQ